MHRTTLTFSYESVRDAETVEQSVGVEVGDIEGDRTTARLERDGTTVSVEVSADDLVALRAGQNTWLSLIQVAERVAGI